MHYIRFLKTPVLSYTKSKQSTCRIQALITVTSDLGDSFFPEDLLISAFLLYEGDETRKPVHRQKHQWKAGMRSLHLQYHINLDNPERLMQLMIVAKDIEDAYHEHQKISLTNIPRITSVWSESFACGKKPLKKEVERRFQLPGDNNMVIREETGESIARHIWDAGLVLATYLSEQATVSDGASHILNEVLKSAHYRALNVIELGSGCGTVGIAFAQAIPNCEVHLTDLPEAEAIINTNITAMIPAHGSKVVFEILDWEKDLPSTVRQRGFDLILVADCTYNPGSAPALVRTLDSLLTTSSEAIIILATKVRHPSEAVFFDLMMDAGVTEIEQTGIPLPMSGVATSPERPSTVDVHLFRKVKSGS